MSLIERHSGQTLLGRLLRLPLKLVPSSAFVPVLTGINRGATWRVGASTHGCWIGTYEASKQSVLARLVHPGMRAFDIGANAGFYTLALSTLVGAQGRVWSFEPFAENLSNCLGHVRANNRSNISVMAAAVADRDGIEGFDIAQSNAMGSLSPGKDYFVPIVTLDSLLAQGVIECPDVIKMDVEGAESRVLKGASAILAQRRTVWLISLHGSEQRRRVMEILSDWSCHVTLLDGRNARSEMDFDEIIAVPCGAA